MGEGLGRVVIVAVVVSVFVILSEVDGMVVGREGRVRGPEVGMKREAGSCGVILGPCFTDSSSS
jgi:hypothetical protein